jgi:apolipoprotein N-acyltransferase
MIDLTVPGWVIATPVQALIMALPMAFIPAHGIGRSISVPSALVVGEALRWVVPFGGVPMSNLALGPVDTYLVDVVRVGGALLLIASIGIIAVGIEGALSAQLRTTLGPLAAIVLLIAVARMSPTGRTDSVINASVVQAGGALGTRAATSNQLAVFDRHLEAIARQPIDTDLMVWSESSVTADVPLETSDELATIAQLATDLDAVIVANFSETDGDRFRNASVSVNPNTGIAGRYDKVHLVPFGEYIPLRGFVENFADLSLIPREALAGDGPGLLESRLGPIGNAISFEVYFPERVRSGIKAGARILTNPTLASSYTTSLVPEQSLASARLRAIETDRWVLQASTTGYSAIVSANGDVVLRSDLREQTVLTTSVELRSGNTWATEFGKLPISLIAMGLLAGTALFEFRRRSSG